MSKRKRQDPILLERPVKLGCHYRQDNLLSNSSVSQNDPVSILGKRSYEPVETNVYKKSCQTSTRTMLGKRSVPFDNEMDRLQKRLRATTPSAEEALAFFLPHLLEMRRLYIYERDKAIQLENENKQLHAHCQLLTRTLKDQMAQKSLVERNLEMTRYRLLLNA